MADYIAASRTNIFRVKDATAFIDAVGRVAPDVVVEVRDWERPNTTPDHGTLPGQAVMMYSESCHGDWPSYTYDEDTGEDSEIDWVGLLTEHMVGQQVCVIVEAGSEKLRYVGGWARAIHSDGREVFVSTNDIYEKASDAFWMPPGSISNASY